MSLRTLITDTSIRAKILAAFTAILAVMALMSGIALSRVAALNATV